MCAPEVVSTGAVGLGWASNLYLTLPLFVYDYLLLAVYKGLGIGFVIPYWYLTFFYFSFWIQFPLVGWWIQRTKTQSVEASAG